jgi:hemoglobin
VPSAGEAGAAQLTEPLGIGTVGSGSCNRLGVGARTYERIGGEARLNSWIERFQDLIEGEERLAPLFGGTLGRTHREHVFAFFLEEFGGPTDYSDRFGGYPEMLDHHRDLAITEEQRVLFIELLSRSADDVGVPEDRELRTELGDYADWASRLTTYISVPEGSPTPAPGGPRQGPGGP